MISNLLSAFFLILMPIDNGESVDPSIRKGLWVRAASMAHPDSIKKIIQIATEFGVTDIYAQVVVGGYAYCDIQNLPRSQYLSKISGIKPAYIF